LSSYWDSDQKVYYFVVQVMVMLKELGKAAELVRKAGSIKVVTHLDADGLSAGGILSQALEREGKDFEIVAVPGIHENNVSAFDGADLTIFSDLGSGQLGLLGKHMKGKGVVVLDHHQVHGNGWQELVQVNPCLDGYDGANDISGAGVAYLFAKELSEENLDLSLLGVVGAVGDIQNFWGKFEGLNVGILEDAVKTGKLSVDKDILFYGRFTRPVYKSLQYFTDPFVPGISNSESGAISLLHTLGIPLKDEVKWRTVADLNHEEKQKIADQFIHRAIAKVPEELTHHVPGLVIGDVYTINDEELPELKDVAEFSTCLNATGRNDRPDIGLKIAEGGRGVYYSALMSLLRRHRKNIAKGISYVEEKGVSAGPENYLQYFDGRFEIDPKIVGTVAGMVLGSEETDPYKPMVGLASTGGGVKVSARCSRILVLQKINMAAAMRKAAESVGGIGGGHTVACGAFIPEAGVDRFITEFEKGLLYQK
jgi:RecJ-like exonuclease